jgi:NAD(P)-dependent dehydrogenase (short-subunit alcohol dehydrogenase family)
MISGNGGVAREYVVDVADATATRNAAERIVSDLGNPAAWINAAAVGIFGPLERSTEEDLDRVMAVSFNGVVHGSQVAAQLMKDRPGNGVIINVGSALAFTTVPYNVPYGAAKAAVRSYSLGLGLELRKSNVTVCIAHLPAIATPWFTKVKTLTPFQSRPVGFTHSPEAVGRAIADLVQKPRFGDSYLGLSTLVVVVASRLFPRLTGWFAHTVGIRLQTTKWPAVHGDNLWQSISPTREAPHFRPVLRRAPHWYPRLGKRR